MTCKDCLHYEACCAIGGKLQEHYMNKCNDVECEYFKDKSEWVHFPCKVGDVVYVASENRGVLGSRVRKMFFGSNGVEMIRTQHYDIPFSNWGKTVFLTRKEAENAFAERRKDDE